VTNVRFGVISGHLHRNPHVCFAPESGHSKCAGDMSAKGQKRTPIGLFDHLVGAFE
jgi:hypothetical protein